MGMYGRPQGPNPILLGSENNKTAQGKGRYECNGKGEIGLKDGISEENMRETCVAKFLL